MKSKKKKKRKKKELTDYVSLDYANNVYSISEM